MNLNLLPVKGAIIASIFLLIGCHASYGLDNETIADLAQNVRYVAGQVHALIAYEKPSEELSGDNLIRQATTSNPAPAASLSDYYLTARWVGSHSSVLLCDSARRQALVEDAGCTASHVEWRHKKNEPAVPCNFHLNLQTVCPAPGR